MNDVIKQARDIMASECRTKEIAQLTGINPSVVSSLRTGKRKLSEAMANRIVEAYNGKPVKKAPPKKPKAKKPSVKKEAPKEKRQQHRQSADEFFQEVKKHDQLEKLEGMARSAVSKIIREEVIPALNEKLSRFIEGIDARVEAAVQKSPSGDGKQGNTISHLIERVAKLEDRVAWWEELNRPKEPEETISEPMVEEFMEAGNGKFVEITHSGGLILSDEQFERREIAEEAPESARVGSKRRWWRRTKK